MNENWRRKQHGLWRRNDDRNRVGEIDRAGSGLSAKLFQSRAEAAIGYDRNDLVCAEPGDHNLLGYTGWTATTRDWVYHDEGGMITARTKAFGMRLRNWLAWNKALAPLALTGNEFAERRSRNAIRRDTLRCSALRGLASLVAAWSLSVNCYATRYDIVQGSQYQLCRALVKNFNEFRDAPPMSCERTFHPKYENFKLPAWRALDPKANVHMLEAAERFKYFVREDDARKMEAWETKLRPPLMKALAEGRVSLREARFDIAHNGEKARVVAYSFGCQQGKDHDFYSDNLVVFLPDQNIVDERYRFLAGRDVFFYQGRPYLSVGTEYPSAVGRSPGPPKRHEGYVLTYETFWLKPGFGARHPGGSAGTGDLVCQIGYKQD